MLNGFFQDWFPKWLKHAHPDFSSRGALYDSTLSLLQQRLQFTPLCQFPEVTRLQVSILLVAPRTERPAFHTLCEHTTPIVAPSPVFSLLSRLKNIARLTIPFSDREIPKCKHCIHNDHSTMKCWRESSASLCPIQSPRLQNLVRARYKTKYISFWKIPPRVLSMSLGSYLTQVLFPAFISRGDTFGQKPPSRFFGPCRNVDGHFSWIPQRAYMWLVIGAPKHVVRSSLQVSHHDWIEIPPLSEFWCALLGSSRIYVTKTSPTRYRK